MGVMLYVRCTDLPAGGGVEEAAAERGAREDAGDVEGDGACHEDVVVMSRDGGVAAGGKLFVGDEFVAGFGAAFDVGLLADVGYEGGYYHGFCGAVGVESGA